MKNILVTGGTGYIGSHTVVELYQAGFNPIIVDNFSNSEPRVANHIAKIVGKKPKLYEGDFSDIKLLESVINTEKIEGIIHFAAYKAVGESVGNPLKYYKNNVAGLINLLAVADKAKISQLVFSSSCTVYGNAVKLPITEAEPMKAAASPYGSTKQFCETIIRDAVAASTNLRAIALRYFNPIGAHPSALIGELPIGTPTILVPFVTQTAAGIRKELVVHGDDYPTKDGTCIRDYIHVVDLAKAHVATLKLLTEQTDIHFDAINIGTGVGSSVLEVIKTFEKTTGVTVPYRIGPRRAGDAISAYAAVNKAQQLLNWKAELTLEDALRDAWRWQQELNQP